MPIITSAKKMSCKTLKLIKNLGLYWLPPLTYVPGALTHNLTRGRARLFINLQYLLNGCGLSHRYAAERFFHYVGNGREGDLPRKKRLDGDLVGGV